MCVLIDLGVFMFKKVYLEITNVCNLDCAFCKKNNREKKFLSKEDFSIILKRLEGFTKYLYFHVMGEPLLHPYINDFLALASDKFFVNITTNGYLIDRIQDNSNIRQVNISLHSFDIKYKKELKSYLDTIFTAVKRLVKHGTIINYRLWIDSKYSSSIIEALEKEYDVTIGNEKNISLAPSIYLDIADEFIWPSLENAYFSEEGSCMGCRTHIGILVDGTIVPCCLDSDGIISLGNIYKQNLNDIINSDLFKEIKEGFLNHRKIHPLCQKCNFYSLRR